MGSFLNYFTGQKDAQKDRAYTSNHNDEKSIELSLNYRVLGDSLNSTTSTRQGSSHLDATHNVYSSPVPTPSRKTKRICRCKSLYDPVKRLSSYGVFFSENNAQIRESNPNATFGEISKLVGVMWQKTTASVKAHYRSRVIEAKEGYMKLVATYMAHPTYASKRRNKLKRKGPCNPKKSNVSSDTQRYLDKKDETKPTRNKKTFDLTRDGIAATRNALNEVRSSKSKGGSTKSIGTSDTIIEDDENTCSGA